MRLRIKLMLSNYSRKNATPKRTSFRRYIFCFCLFLHGWVVYTHPLLNINLKLIEMAKRSKTKGMNLFRAVAWSECAEYIMVDEQRKWTKKKLYKIQQRRESTCMVFVASDDNALALHAESPIQRGSAGKGNVVKIKCAHLVCDFMCPWQRFEWLCEDINERVRRAIPPPPLTRPQPPTPTQQ